MKHLRSFFESTTTSDKYLINLSSANSLGIYDRFKSDPDSITQQMKDSAEKNWSLYAMLNKIEIRPVSLRTLSNKELAEEICKRRIYREYYDEVSKEFGWELHRLFNKFKKEISIDNKLELMSYLEEEGWTFCSNSDIIKVVNLEELRDELEIISDI